MADHMFTRFQNAGAKSKSIGYISSLPTIIHKDKTALPRLEKSAKFPAGPTVPKPGPILLRHAITAVVVETISLLSSDNTIADAANTAK